MLLLRRFTVLPNEKRSHLILDIKAKKTSDSLLFQSSQFPWIHFIFGQENDEEPHPPLPCITFEAKLSVSMHTSYIWSLAKKANNVERA